LNVAFAMLASLAFVIAASVTSPVAIWPKEIVVPSVRSTRLATAPDTHDITPVLLETSADVFDDVKHTHAEVRAIRLLAVEQNARSSMAVNVSTRPGRALALELP
jgi:hypothetical protein